MHVDELLRNKGATVATVRPDETVRIALHELSRHNVGDLDVVGAAVLELPVRSIMSDMVLTCSPSDTVESLTAVMTTNRIRHVPVVEDGHLVGLVSIGDVVKTRMDELENDRVAL